jgi:drug/metabolite transporter (DMT)-like permease
MRTLAAVLFTVITWASAFPAIRAVLVTYHRAYSPGPLALLRFLIASAVLAILAPFARVGLPRLRDVPGLALLGACGVAIYHLLLNYGALTVPAGPTALLVNTAPIFTALLAMLFLGERLAPWGWVGIVVSFTGAAVIAGTKKGGLAVEPGALMILLAAVIVAVYFVGQKPYLRRYGAMAVTTYALWSGTLLLGGFTPTLWRELHAAPLHATMAVVYLGVFPAALAYATWSYALANMPASVAGSFMYISPPTAFLIAWVWLGERPGIGAVVGGTLAIAGVVIVNTWGKRRRVSAADQRG